jgi:hypothetical protein
VAGTVVVSVGAVAVSVGTLNWVDVGEAAGVTAGTVGAEVDTKAQALMAITSAIEAMRIRHGFIGISPHSRTSFS